MIIETQRKTEAEAFSEELTSYLQALAGLDSTQFALLAGASQKAAWRAASPEANTVEQVRLAEEIARETGRDALLVRSQGRLSAGILTHDRQAALWAGYAALAIVIKDFITTEHYAHLTGPVRAARIALPE